MSASKRRDVVLLGLALLFSILSLQAAERGPSTPEERQRALLIARAYEADPLDEELQEDRKWALQWISEVSDISVTVCANVLLPILAEEEEYKYTTQILAQMVLSSTAFVIENKDESEDLLKVNEAGLRGVLKAYEAMLLQRPDAEHTFLESLIQKREQGELMQYVKENCTASE